MTIKTESKMITISLRLWRGGWNAGFEPDCFQDLETNFRCDHEYDSGSDTIFASDADAQNLISWWRDECDSANSGNDGECLLALSEDEIARGDEWQLIVDEEDL